jgi:probable rRNA maturation factor
MSKVSRVTVNLDVAVDDFEPSLTDEVYRSAAAAIAASRSEAGHCALNIRFVDREESVRLNAQFRSVARPTNVLAFPAGEILLPDDGAAPELGDLAICLPVVQAEAKEQNKELQEHVAHMVIHGTLHLLGYDHIDDAEAEDMESLERAAMEALGFADPYQPIN